MTYVTIQTYFKFVIIVSFLSLKESSSERFCEFSIHFAKFCHV